MGRLKSWLMAIVITSFTMGTALAADVEMRGVFFDNDTGNELTTITKNVGVRILVTNNSTLPLNPVSFSQMYLDQGLVLHPMAISALSGTIVDGTDTPPRIRWSPNKNLINVQPNFFAVGSGSTVSIQAGVFPVKDAILEQVSGNTKLGQLKTGLYFPTVTIEIFNSQANTYQAYSVGKEPVKVEK